MSNLKKVLALVLVLALSLTMFAGAIETVLPYDDVDELTAEQLDALKLLYALGVIKGDGEDSVNPTDTLTRAELSAILYRLYTGDAEEKYVSTYSTDCPYFDDVEDGKWYVPYVNWAYIKGVIAGYGDGNFGPEDNVDGIQAATMLSRLVGYEIGSENWELVARKYALELGLDDGVSSKDLFGTDLSRGDMIVMVANVLDCYEVGTKVTLAEKIFDLEIIHGAILLGADKLGSTDYSVFAFKDEIAGNVKYFITDLLSIEEKPTVDEIGQKYTLYVAKTTEVNGYKVLYAAYEEEEGAYYQTVTGTVDDGKLNVKDPDKDDYLLKLLDNHVIAYVNGDVVANNKADAFAAFKASYGLKNSATYKLIDNDGDGKYEYIFVQRLTLAAMNTTKIVANVVSYNNITGAYTLSDGNTYLPGQYWAVDKDDKITNNVVNAVDAIRDAIGTGNFTASSVQYQFTIENGKYIMLAEICDETYFAGDYVLAQGVVGTSTYKGMQYVQFLTEDNTTLYAYVSKINHNDVRNVANWNDNSWLAGIKFVNELYYINAYGDDTVEVFTPIYMNSNYVNDYVDGNTPGSIDVSKEFSRVVLPSVDAVYTNIGIEIGANGGFVPARKFNYRDAYALLIDGKYVPVLFTKSTYAGYFASLANNVSEALKAAEAALEDARELVVDAGEVLTLWKDWVDLKKTVLNGTATAAQIAAENDAWVDLNKAYTAIWPDYTVGTYFAGVTVVDAAAVDTATENFKTDLEDWKAKTIAAAEKAVEDAKKATVTSNVYYMSAPGRDDVELVVSLDVTYRTREYQIFKAYGTWYLQNYTSNYDNNDYRVYFTVDGQTWEVISGADLTDTETNTYLDDRYYVVTGYDENDNPVVGKIFSLGAYDESAMATSIQNAIDAITGNNGWDSDNDGNDDNFIWGDAISLNTSKGVVFAYGEYPVDGRYTWRAYNFDEFNVNFFGEGGPNDDAAIFDAVDELIYTISNGQYYAKAAKVTVSKNDTLPMGWMVENSMLFIYGEARGTITIDGQTVQAILPNGATKDVFISYGMLNTNVPNSWRYGNVYYAVLDENGNVVSVEYICNVFDVFKSIVSGRPTGDLIFQVPNIDEYLDYSADGTVKVKGKLGLTYNVTIDIENTFFVIDPNQNGRGKFVSSADFAKYLDEHPNAPFEIYVDAYGYNYAYIG